MPLGPAGLPKLIAEEVYAARLLRCNELHGLLARAEHVQHLLEARPLQGPENALAHHAPALPEARRLQDQANGPVPRAARETPVVAELAPCAHECGERQRVDEAH